MKKLKANGRERLWFYAFLSPWIIGFLAFTIVPMCTSIYYSFFRMHVFNMNVVDPVFVGADNFKYIFEDRLFLKSIGNTFWFTAVRVPVGLIVSVLFALLLNQKIRGVKLFRTLIYLPAMIPVVGSTIVWKQLFSNDFSLLNFLLGGFGIPAVRWSSYENAMWSVLLMSIWCGIGPSMIVILAGLQNIPTSLMEAAELDGASPVSKFFHISLPMISSTLFYLLITGIIGALQTYAEMSLLQMPGDSTTTMTMVVVQTMYRMDGYGIGYSSAMSWFIFVVVGIVTAIFFRISNKFVYYEGGDNGNG